MFSFVGGISSCSALLSSLLLREEEGWDPLGVSAFRQWKVQENSRVMQGAGGASLAPRQTSDTGLIRLLCALLAHSAGSGALGKCSNSSWLPKNL